MKEEKIKIKSKNFCIYGKMSGMADSPLVIIVHGFDGNMDEELYVSATKWLNNNGYAVFRYNLYGRQNDARKLVESTIKSQSEDLEQVVKYFKKENRRIYIIGHSFASLIIFSSKIPDCNAVILWDPTYKFSFLKKEEGVAPPEFIKEKNIYILNWEKKISIKREHVLEVESFPWDSVANNFIVPTIIISANSKGFESSRKYFKKLTSKKAYKEIKEASHYFDDSQSVRNLLFKETKDWMEKF